MWAIDGGIGNYIRYGMSRSDRVAQKRMKRRKKVRRKRSRPCILSSGDRVIEDKLNLVGPPEIIPNLEDNHG